MMETTFEWSVQLADDAAELDRGRPGLLGFEDVRAVKLSEFQLTLGVPDPLAGR